MKKLVSATAGVLVAAAVSTAPMAAATPEGPRPANGTITGYSTTMYSGKSVTLTITPNEGVDYANVGSVALKFDDGLGYGSSIDHGKGVVATLERQSDGTYAGKIKCHVRFDNTSGTSGNHWLRALAKAPNGTIVSAKSQANITFKPAFSTDDCR